MEPAVLLKIPLDALREPTKRRPGEIIEPVWPAADRSALLVLAADRCPKCARPASVLHPFSGDFAGLLKAEERLLFDMAGL